MDLYDQPTLELTRYVDSVEYLESEKRVSILFNCGPEGWLPSHRLVFSNVQSFSKEIFDDEDRPGVNNFTDLVIGFDLLKSGYCLHLTTVEYLFKSNEKPISEKIK